MPIALQRLWLQLTADRRRFGALVAVCLVALLLWARVIVVSDPPRRAVAGEGGNSVASTRGSRTESTKSGERGSDSTDAGTRRVELASQLSRDPFLINPKHFPKPNFPAGEARDEGKSGLSEAERQQRDESLRLDRVRSIAGQLTLEAVMKGAALAVIDGRTFRVGETISPLKAPELTFTLVEVGERSVVLECEELRFELRLTN